MRTRRTSYRNKLGIPAIAAIVIVVASLALVGLGIVISKNRVRALGEEQRKVEQEIRLLRSEIQKLEQNREKIFTSERLQPWLTAAATMLKDLDENRIILPAQNPPAQDNAASGADPETVPVAIPVARAITQSPSSAQP